ncbi:MAG TPA: hypothetical protein VK747_17665 [Blastocatellia bacterium]|nr:hypothetical protein [Blastocatellia bacterium]
MTNRQAAKDAKVSVGSFDLGVLGGLAVLLSSNTEIGHYKELSRPTLLLTYPELVEDAFLRSVFNPKS